MKHQAGLKIVSLNRIVAAGIGAAFFLAILIIADYLILRKNIEAEQSSAAEINLSGRQRMLTQRISNLAQDMVMFPERRSHYRQQLLNVLDLMERSHHGLIYGDPAMGLKGDPSPEIKAMYFSPPLNLDRQVRVFIDAGRALAREKDAALTPENPHFLLIHRAADQTLPAALDALVRQYQNESEQSIIALKRLGLLLSSTILAVILLMALFIFLPIVRTTRDAIARLTASETTNRAIVDTMVDALITIDEAGIILSFNPAAERIFGYPSAEIIGKNVNTIIPEPHQTRHNGYLRNYLKTREKKVIGRTIEVEGRRRDGSTFPVELTVNEMFIDGKTYFAGTIRDISERKRIEAEITAKNRELEIRGRYDHSYANALTLFSSTYNRKEILDGLLAILADHHPFPVSAFYTADEWSGKLTLSASYGAPDTLKREFEAGEGLIGQAAARDKPVILDHLGEESEELLIEAGIFTLRPATLIASPVRYQKKTMGVLVLASTRAMSDLDANFIRRLSIQIGVALNNLKQYNNLKELSTQLKARGIEISRKNLELEEANRMKSEFLATMSHELRTPLNAIIGFSEVLKDGLMGSLNSKQKEYVTDIYNSGQHLLGLINDILDLSKIEAGKMELDLEQVDMADLVQSSLSIIREKAMSHRIRLDKNIGQDVGTCWLDPRKTKQMIYNLLSNAVKFTPEGGHVHISVERISGKELEEKEKTMFIPEFRSDRLPDSDFLEISVSDTGIGIRKEDQKKLFQPFVQLDSSLSRQHEGTGLGLAMVRRMAELHGGMAGVKSRPGHGSTFTLWLPYHADIKDRPGKTPRLRLEDHSKETSGRDHHVLIIEDDPVAADLMRIQLESNGYRTSRVATAEEALDILEQSKPDLITLDILLPGMDGWDFLEKIRKNGDLARIPVVIVSIVADEKKGFSLGASQVLQKPAN
jgi:PAS domain S-box-containing protein